MNDPTSKLVDLIELLGKAIEAQGTAIDSLVELVKVAAKSDPLDFTRNDVLETKLDDYTTAKNKLVEDTKAGIAPILAIWRA